MRVRENEDFSLLTPATMMKVWPEKKDFVVTGWWAGGGWRTPRQSGYLLPRRKPNIKCSRLRNPDGGYPLISAGYPDLKKYIYVLFSRKCLLGFKLRVIADVKRRGWKLTRNFFNVWINYAFKKKNNMYVLTVLTFKKIHFFILVY